VTTEEPVKNLHFKAMNGQMTVDEAQGIVECFVAAIGNKDSVGDIIVPGAFDTSFRKRKPRVVWGHDWNQPIGKVLEIYEVGPRDPRLPGKMKQAGVGGVFAKVQFNLASERGREAFSNVLFFGEEQEWSIGYKTLDAVWDPNTQANVLRELELYEVSPVLHGANQLTGTISIKDAKGEEKDEITSLRDSKWDTFDIAWAKKLKDEHPDIWAKGGNIKGNDQWRILTQIAAKGRATTQAELNALKLREAWIARHKGDFRLPGVIAQIKWLAVGTRGEDYMKDIVREAVDRGEKDDRHGLSVKGHDSGVTPGAFVRWSSSGGTAYGKVLKVVKGGVVKAKPVGPSMRGTADEPAVQVRVYRFADGRWDETETVTVHRHDALQAVEGLPESKAAPGAEKLQNLADALGDRIPTGSNLVPDVLPQERVTGDVLHGHGPRRGNLEKLLRYWRPIMRKPGGFRRCRVILADHPELYPLENLCAWLHHETTGLWPNEGCHHPGMKNCRRKLKRVVNGSLFSDSEFDNRLRRLGKSADGMTDYDYWAGQEGLPWDEDYEDHEEYEDEEHEADEELMLEFGEALRRFARQEPEFMDYLADDDNWVHEGQEHDEDDWHEHVALVPMGKQGCGCGGGCGGKAEPHGDLAGKAGRTLSTRNRTKLQDAVQLIKSVIDEGEITVKSATVTYLASDDPHGLASGIAPVVAHHDLAIVVEPGVIGFKSDNMTAAAAEALSNALGAFGYDAKGFLRRMIGGNRGGGGGRRAIGRARQIAAAYEPDAFDGDNDGIVQDHTPFERPAAARAADTARKLVSDAEAAMSLDDGGMGMGDAVRSILGNNDRPNGEGEVKFWTPIISRSMSGDLTGGEHADLFDSGLHRIAYPDGDGPAATVSGIVRRGDSKVVADGSDWADTNLESLSKGDVVVFRDGSRGVVSGIALPELNDSDQNMNEDAGFDVELTHVRGVPVAPDEFGDTKHRRAVTDPADMGEDQLKVIKGDRRTVDLAKGADKKFSDSIAPKKQPDDSAAAKALLKESQNYDKNVADGWEELSKLVGSNDLTEGGLLTDELQLNPGNDPQDSFGVSGKFVDPEAVTGNEIIHDAETGRVGAVLSADDPAEGDRANDVNVLWLFGRDGKPLPLGGDNEDTLSSENIRTGPGDGSRYEISRSDALEAFDLTGFADTVTSTQSAISMRVREAIAADDPDMIYALKDRLSPTVYMALLERFNRLSGRGAKSALRVGLGTHKSLLPVVRHHDIPHTIDGKGVSYDLASVTEQARDALTTATAALEAETKRDYSTTTRDSYAGKGWALPDGSFPIRDKGDLDNAIKAYGRAKDKPAAKAHIVKRARALKATAMLPEGWA
jgi:HK97 family phage prohead protease